MPWFVLLLIQVAIQAIIYLVTPKPAAPKPAAVQDAQAPLAEAGRPIPVIFGEVTIDGTNVLWWGRKSTNTYQISA